MMIGSAHSGPNCSITTVTTVSGERLLNRLGSTTHLESLAEFCNVPQFSPNDNDDLLLLSGHEREGTGNGYLPNFDSSDDSSVLSPDSDEEKNLTELGAISGKDQMSCAMVKVERAVSYGVTKSQGLPDLDLYPSVTSFGEQVPDGMYDNSDSIFDDAFSLDEFVIGGEGRMYQGDQFQNYHNEMSRNQVRQISSCNGLENDGEQDLFQTIMSRQENPMPCTTIQPFAIGEQQQGGPQPFYREIRNRTFSDLLKDDMSGVDASGGQSFPPCITARTRDYSVSSDSGVGSSILEATNSPPNRNPDCFSGGSPETSLTTQNGNQAIMPSKSERFPSHVSDMSTRDDDANGDILLAACSPPQDGAVQGGEEKVASKKTAYNEKWGVKVLKAWCGEMSISEHFENLSPEQLNDLLSRFWAEVRKSNGDYYGRNSLFNLRAMINKHLKGKPYCAEFDIVTDERFRTSNDTLEKQLKILKGIGKTISHKQPISIADLRKMYDSKVLGTDNPQALLRKVWFEITLHFCHKGSEPQEKLTRTSFQVYRDQNYRAYISRSPDAKCSSDTEEIRMYETRGELCPVQSYQRYLQKLHPLQGRLFQQPRRKSTPSSPMWYGKAPIGEKALQQMMANISVAAKLSKRYTNHCVRTTALEQFSTSKKKLGGRNSGDKSNQRSRANMATKTTNRGAPLYPTPQAQNTFNHQQKIYYKEQTPQVPYNNQPPRLPTPNHPYDIGMYENISGSIPNMAFSDNTMPPSPIKNCGVEQGRINHQQRYYKRTASHAFSENAYQTYSDLPPPPSYPGPGQPAKKPRLQNCHVFLSRDAPVHSEWRQDNQYQNNGQITGAASNMPNLFATEKRHPEMIMPGGGRSGMKSISNENFAMLSSLV